MVNPDLHAFWQKTLSDWQESGVSGAAFCKQQSLSYHRFVYWRRKLNGSTNIKKALPSGFARAAPVPKGQAKDGLTVTLPGGVSITGLHAGNIELLGMVLRQL